MNTPQLSMLLARIQVLDNRQVDALTLEAWEPLVGDLDYDDAVAAVNNHFRTTRNYLLPADVVSGATQAKKERVALARQTPHRFEPGGSRLHPQEVCIICLSDKHRHATDGLGCAHVFDETSGYCHGCGLRDDDDKILNPPIPIRGAA